ncbi:FAD binding domain-containing protein [Spirilliplanes yamanashiensis]|uniref:Carbon-monoxide dehydrogenase medium subunit n=1 Tax=Spirilliplanes yamanashiensis TaxID=42233 RepID=A0A8J4DLL8_9ACTN|nr:FAD binding domain-containing protein [Spirilliplanes yamanashiensis]MDP9818766.1 CO/xanthine dehydrogenase FAD-binding subunit [Spirilliplanes yamanashiensis]GIJ05220.1 carbon-monoxide dehydrogenase medium subunit [Spirilliplanes yamanashiensis]
MDFHAPGTLADALAVKAAHPDALPIAGGTDVMVDLNFDRRRPPALIDLTRVGELRAFGADGAHLRIGAGVPYRQIIDQLAARAPGLALAARTIGSPQIRNRGTLGGNLGSASPAGDAHPPLLAAGAVVELASVRGTRTVPAAEFFTGPKRSVLAADELVTAVLLPVAPGPQQFAKVGTRTAMVIAVCSFAVALDPVARTVGTGIGSAGPTPLRATAAHDLPLPWDTAGPLDDDLVRRFGELVAAAARPIDDVRGTAAYRRHALGVLARRTLTWAWDDYRKGRA